MAEFVDLYLAEQVPQRPKGASCDDRHQGQVVTESCVEGVAVTFLIDTCGNITIVKPAVCPRIT